jgi:DNA gyrase subunit A
MTRKYQTLLAKEMDKKEIQEGLIKACDVIDLIIEILRGSKNIKEAKECLMTGNTANIRFKTKTSEKDASQLRFTERQATAILEMRLYKLIGLEIEALRKEHETTLKNIANYEDILGNRQTMTKTIIKELESIKKEHAKPRKTIIENAAEAVYEEKKIEEQEVVFLMDRFGYTKTIDTAAYERNKEAVLNENRYVFTCMNTDKICIFTDKGMLHTVKVIDLPYGKFRDKGIPIDNLCNYSSSEENMVFITNMTDMKDRMLLFTTKTGMMKQVNGNEFDVAKRTVAATKLAEQDEIVSIDMVDGLQNIVIQTNTGVFLRFLSDEVPEKKRGAIGVRGIKLSKGDFVEELYKFDENSTINIMYRGKEISLNRLKIAGRDTKGTKARI